MMVGDEDLKMSLLVMIKDNHCQFRCSYCPMERECTTQEFKDLAIAFSIREGILTEAEIFEVLL